MRICIDISQSVYQRGVGRYTRELVAHLLKIDQENEYVLFGSSLRQQKTLKKFINPLKPNPFDKLRVSPEQSRRTKTLNLKPKLYPIPPTILEILFNRFHLSIDPFVGKIDIFHSSDWTQPKTRAKKATTIHDMIAAKFPELFDAKTIAVQKRRLKWVKSEVDKIIAVSQNTKKDIVEVLQVPESKIEVIYEAATPAFYPRKEEEIEAVKKKFGIKKDYLLTVNTRTSQKITQLAEAFKILAKEFDVELVVVGEKIPDAEKIIQTGILADEDLARLYSGTSAFVFTSIYEGFGLPVLEAMVCGAPVICSATSSLPEVAGNAAVFVNPNSREEITEKVQKVLASNKFTQELSQASLNQANRFSWEKTAIQTLEVYNEVFKI